MKRRVKYSGNISTYFFKVLTPGSPASMSQRRNDAGLLLKKGVDLRDDVESLWRVKRHRGRKFNEHIDRIGARDLNIEACARRDRLLLVRHLIGETVPWFKIRINQAEPSDYGEAYQTVKPGAADHAASDKTAETAEHLDAKIAAPDLLREDSLVAQEQNT
jgi:hypothetical protein